MSKNFPGPVAAPTYTADNENPASCVLRPTAYIRFWVKDNGPGLTTAQQSQLFQAFSRLDTECAEEHGLGLSIVQRIIEKFDGTAGVESTPGEGCTFWFTLPYANEAW